MALGEPKVQQSESCLETWQKLKGYFHSKLQELRSIRDQFGNEDFEIVRKKIVEEFSNLEEWDVMFMPPLSPNVELSECIENTRSAFFEVITFGLDLSSELKKIKSTLLRFKEEVQTVDDPEDRAVKSLFTFYELSNYTELKTFIKFAEAQDLHNLIREIEELLFELTSFVRLN